MNHPMFFHTNMTTMERSAHLGSLNHPTRKWGSPESDCKIELKTPNPSSNIHRQRLAAGTTGITKGSKYITFIIPFPRVISFSNIAKKIGGQKPITMEASVNATAFTTVCQKNESPK